MRSLPGAFFIVAALFSGNAHANNDEYECVAEKPVTGILDTEKLSNFEAREDDFKFYEAGYLISEPAILLAVEAGGCAHYGVALTFTFDDREPIENNGHYLEKVRDLLDITPFKEDSLYWKSDFLRALDKHENDTEAHESGIYVLQPGYSTVYLTADREDHRVTLTISHDIAL